MKSGAKQVKAILFDLDGTLLDRERSLVDFVQQQYVRFQPGLVTVPRSVYVARFVELDAQGHVWKDQVYQQLLAEFSLTHLAWGVLLEDYVENFQHHCVGFPGLHNMLQALLAQGYQLGLITNGRTVFQTQTIHALGIAPYFSTILISEAEHVRKPEPEIFQRALYRLGVDAREAIFVGDDPEADIRGTQGVGMRTIWKRRPLERACTWADGVCDDLAHLPEMIQQGMI
jgi:putative hydrolase of the HAD superfamily